MTAVSAALVDTDVFSLLYLRRKSTDPRVAMWRRLLAGRRVLISFQTRAEILAGALDSNWGERRLTEARAILDTTPTVRPDDDVVDAFARLVAECRQAGHALRDRQHTSDRWVAACAIAKEVELLAGDGIYRNAPRLRLLD